jgi:uncharacterized membrane protein YgcG
MTTLGGLITAILYGVAALTLGLAWYRSRDRYFAGVIPGLLPASGDAAPERRRLRAQRKPAAVRFDPPPGVPAALCGVILRKRATRSAVAATITDLAVRGYLTIAETPDGFRISRVREPDTTLAGYERQIVASLYLPVVLPGDRAASGEFRSALAGVPGMLTDAAVWRGWFTADPRQNRFRGWGTGLLVVSLWPAMWLAERDLLWWWAPFALGMAGLIAVPGRWLTGRTAVGSATLAQVLDFRRYIETAEAEQLAAEERQAIFNRYLPYAQAFGLAEHWTRKFAAVGAAVPGSWYVGSGETGGGGPVYFGDSYLTFASTVDSSVGSGHSAGDGGGWGGDGGGGGWGGGGFDGGGGGDGGGSG